MELTADNKLKKLIVVGDRVLIKPQQESDKTSSGIYLPPGVQQQEPVQAGYIVKAGPGYPVPYVMDEGDEWKPEDEKVRYVPLQAREGDKAIFLQKAATEIKFNGEKYFIVPQSSILMLEREEDLFD